MLFHSSGLPVVSLFKLLDRFFYESRIQNKLFHLFGFCWGFFSTLLDGSEVAVTRNKSLRYLLLITHIIHKALIYISDTEGRHVLHFVNMTHSLSITRALIPFVKEQITYLKPGHLDPDSSDIEHLYSLIAALNTHTHRKGTT